MNSDLSRSRNARESYITTMLNLRDVPEIKIVSGVRGCGKSLLLKTFRCELASYGIEHAAVIYVDLELYFQDFTHDRYTLDAYLRQRLDPSVQTYVLLDEITIVDQWEELLSCLCKDYSINLYLCTSTSLWKSDAFLRYFSGAYIEIPVFPLSFVEFLKYNHFEEDLTLDEKFEHYIKYGGLPISSRLSSHYCTSQKMVTGIYNTILISDILQHNIIKDVPMFDRISRYLVANIGTLDSPKNISDHFTNGGRKIASETVNNYITALENAYVFYRIPRYDIKTEKVMKTKGKYYIADTGMRHIVTGYHGDYGYELENVVCLELLRRGYQVLVGKMGQLEIDFIVKKEGQTQYFQVTQSIFDHDTFTQRELLPLRRLKDQHPRTILSMDYGVPHFKDGIYYQNIIDFLLGHRLDK